LVPKLNFKQNIWVILNLVKLGSRKVEQVVPDGFIPERMDKSILLQLG
jgi:hypothetical protein